MTPHSFTPARAKYLAKLNEVALIDRRLRESVGLFDLLSTDTLGKLIGIPSYRTALPELVENARLPCTVHGCTSRRDGLVQWCARHAKQESAHGDIARRKVPPAKLVPIAFEVRALLTHPDNAASEHVVRLGHVLRAWVADPAPPNAGKTPTRILYTRAREAIRDARPKASEVVLAVVPRLVHAIRCESTQEPLVDPMSLKFSRYGATEIGRGLANLIPRGAEKPLKLTGHARRMLAESLPEIARITCVRLAEAVEGERHNVARIVNGPPPTFASPSRGAPLTPNHDRQETPADRS